MAYEAPQAVDDRLDRSRQTRDLRLEAAFSRCAQAPVQDRGSTIPVPLRRHTHGTPIAIARSSRDSRGPPRGRNEGAEGERRHIMSTRNMNFLETSRTSSKVITLGTALLVLFLFAIGASIG